MKKCNNCNINIDTPSSRCPICGSFLKGKKEESTYPKVKKTNAPKLKVLLFITLTVIIITTYLNIQISGNLTWGKYTIFGSIVFYMVIRNILKSHRDVMNLLTRYCFLLVLVLIILFLLTKWYVITDYVIPILCMTELILSSFYAIVIKNKYIKKYLSVIVTNMLVSFIPIILIMFNMTTFNILANISYILSLLLFIGLFIFDFEDLKEELEKIFNY